MWERVGGFLPLGWSQMSKLMPQWRRTDVLEAVFDQLSDGLVLYDRDLTIAGVNRMAENLFGMTSEEMVANPAWMFSAAGCVNPRVAWP